jgi:hypothetical protein
VFDRDWAVDTANFVAGSVPKDGQREVRAPRGRNGTHMVSSAILNETAVTDECGVKKSACSRFPAASYMCWV